MFRTLALLLFLLHTVTPLHITVDSDGGKDSPYCLTAAVSCQSLEYVAKYVSNTTNVTVEINSTSLTLEESVLFTEVNGLTLIGQGPEMTTISCNGGSLGILLCHCEDIRMSNFTLANCGINDSAAAVPAGFNDDCTRMNDSFALTVTKLKGMLLIENCNFVNNTAGSFVSMTYGALQIDMKENSFCFVIIHHCNFTGNADMYKEYGGTGLHGNADRHNYGGTGLHLYFKKSHNNTFNIKECLFTGNRPGLNVFAERNSTGNIINVTDCRFSHLPNHNSCGLRALIETSSSNAIYIKYCLFKYNYFPYGAGMNIIMKDLSKQNVVEIYGSIFLQNNASDGGGGANLGFIQEPEGPRYYPQQNRISFYQCKFYNNSAKFAGGVGIFTASVSLRRRKSFSLNLVRFYYCSFSANKAYSGAAVHVNKDIPRETGSFFISSVSFHNCNFTNNTQHDNKLSSNSTGVIQSGVLYANEVWIYIKGTTLFKGNSGTAVQVSSTTVEFNKNSVTRFVQNKGVKGGAILLTGNSQMFLKENVTLTFESNYAIQYGGAIAVIRLQVQNLGYADHCFLSTRIDLDGKYNKNYSKPVLNFTDNNSGTGFGKDIFAPSWTPCLEKCSAVKRGHYRLDDIFTKACFGTFNFRERSIASATKTLQVNSPIQLRPGTPYKLSIKQMDEFGKDTSKIFPLTISTRGDHGIEVSPKILTNNTHITLYGNPMCTGQLILQTSIMSTITVAAKVELGQCPPGYVLNTKKGSCVCSAWNHMKYVGIRYCADNYSAITVGFWAGYLNEINANEETFVTGYCSIELCNFEGVDHQFGIYQLPRSIENVSSLSDIVCSSNRTGIMCSSCKENYSTSYHSPSFTCIDSGLCCYGILFYILSELFPITVIFIVIIVFNIYLTSGTLYTFIFYAQIIDNLFPDAFRVIKFNSRLSLFMTVLRTIYGLADFNILYAESFSFCIVKNANIMDTLLFKYITTVYALCLVLVTIVILKLNSLYTCVRLGRKCGRKDIRGSVINGLTAFIVLCYCQSVYITIEILLPSELYGKGGQVKRSVLLYAGHIEYMSSAHLKYAIPALVCLVVIILPPPIILLSEPLLVQLSGLINMRRNAVSYYLQKVRMKLKPFLDSFQGCFKDKCRCFAGLFFLYRMLLLVPLTFSGGIGTCYINALFIMFVIIILHCLVRPFQSKWHNHFDQFLLINLFFVNSLTVSNYFITVWKLTNDMYVMIPVIQAILMSIPIIIIFIIPLGQYIWKKMKDLLAKRSDDNLNWPDRLLDNGVQLTDSYGSFQ